MYPDLNIFLNKLNQFIKKSKDFSLSTILFPNGCCGIHIISSNLFKNILEISPKQADFLIVAGPVSKKMVPFIKKIYEQIPNPKWVIGFGACALTGGPFYKSYSIIKGVDEIIPVDIYISGCPPSIESLINGINILMEKNKIERKI